MAILLLIAAISLEPRVTDIRVDAIEMNHVGDFDQYIFWDWVDHEQETRRCMDWRHARICGRLINTRPYQLWWHEGGRLIRVTSHSYEESWTDWDPEIADRYVFPFHERRRI